MDICRDTLARCLVDVLENVNGSRRIVLQFTAARQKGTGRLRVVRCTRDGADGLVLTVAVEGKGGG